MVRSRDYSAQWTAARRFATRSGWAAIAAALLGVVVLLLLPAGTPFIPFMYTWILEVAMVAFLAAGTLVLRCPACGARFGLAHTFRDLDRMTRCLRCGVDLSRPVPGPAPPTS